MRPHRSCREGRTLPQLDIHRWHRGLCLQWQATGAGTEEGLREGTPQRGVHPQGVGNHGAQLLRRSAQGPEEQYATGRTGREIKGNHRRLLQEFPRQRLQHTSHPNPPTNRTEVGHAEHTDRPTEPRAAACIRARCQHKLQFLPHRTCWNR